MLAGVWGTAGAGFPSGWAPGMLALLVEVVPQASGGLPGVPEGWSPQAAAPMNVDALGVKPWLRVSTRVLRTGDTAPAAPSGVSGWWGRVLVDDTGASGVQVVTGAARVTVPEGGVGVVAGVTSTDTDPAGEGVDWLPGRAQVTSRVFLYYFTSYVTLGAVETAGTAGSSQVQGLGVVFLPPVGPRPPELTAPGAGDEVNAAATTQWSWQHRPSRAGGSQGGWSWRISSAAGWLYWSAALGSLTATETTNPGAAGGFDLPGGSLGDLGASRVWTARTVEALDGLVSSWAPERTVTPVTPPGLAVTVTATHNDLSPTITGTPAITRPGSVVVASQWQARDTTGVVVWDSGVQGGSGVSQDVPPTTPWDDGAQYTGWGRIQQTGGAWSPWVSSAPFVVSWDAPATPVVTVATDPEGGALVDVTGLVPGAAVVVESSRDDGLTWDLVHAGVAAESTMRLRDPLVAHLEPMRWSVTQYTVVDGVRLPSERGVSDVLVPASRVSILASAHDPASTWQRVHISQAGDTVWPRETAVHHLLGPDPYALVLRGPERARRGSMVLTARDAQARALLHDLLQCGDPLVMQWCPEDDWHHQSVRPGERVTIQATSPHSEARLAHIPWQPRHVPVEWVEAPTPQIGAAPALAPVTHPVTTVP